MEEYREKLDLTDYRNLEKRYFYDAALIMIDSSIVFAHRFSELAKQEAEKERDEKRKKELEEIALHLLQSSGVSGRNHVGSAAEYLAGASDFTDRIQRTFPFLWKTGSVFISVL